MLDESLFRSEYCGHSVAIRYVSSDMGMVVHVLYSLMRFFARCTNALLAMEYYWWTTNILPHQDTV